MERKAPFVQDEYYHLYNRGVDKRNIFSSSADYKRFLMLLFLSNSTEDIRISNLLKGHAYEEVFFLERGAPLIAIGAFCLMPNHFHILATPLVKDGISRFMLKLQTGYSMYFNIRYERSGSLFQGPFKSEHARNDRYLKYLFSYIHLNPAKIKEPKWREKLKDRKSLLTFTRDYPYSSFKEYLTAKHIVTTPGAFPKYFSSKQDIISHLTDWFV